MHVMPVIGFLVVVFAAVFILLLGITNSASGNSRVRRTLRRRLERINAEAHEDVASILREKYLTSLTPFERRLEEMPFMQKLADMGEQAGRPKPGYQVVFNCILLALIAGLAAGLVLQSGFVGLLAAVAGFFIAGTSLVVHAAAAAREDR